MQLSLEAKIDVKETMRAWANAAIERNALPAFVVMFGPGGKPMIMAQAVLTDKNIIEAMQELIKQWENGDTMRSTIEVEI